MPPRAHIPKVCLVCDTPYLATTEEQLACDHSCRARLRFIKDPERKLVIQAAVEQARASKARKRVDAADCRSLTVEQARRLRLARERAQGYRTHTIQPDSTYTRQDGRVVELRGGWIQRPGAGTIDGANGA